MPAMKVIDEVHDLRQTSERLLVNTKEAVIAQIIMFEVTEVIGRWNITAHVILNEQRSEIARAEDISGPGIYVLEPRARFTHPASLVPSPGMVRYFSSSQFARLSGNLWVASLSGA